MSNGVDAFEQIAAQTEEDARADSPLPISTANGASQRPAVVGVSPSFEGSGRQLLLFVRIQLGCEFFFHLRQILKAS